MKNGTAWCDNRRPLQAGQRVMRRTAAWLNDALERDNISRRASRLEFVGRVIISAVTSCRYAAAAAAAKIIYQAQNADSVTVAYMHGHSFLLFCLDLQ